MKTSGPLRAQFQPFRLTALLLAVALVPAVFAGSRTSANYTVTADTADAGGRHATSTAYSNDGSLGNVAGSGTSAAFTLAGGYVAQLQAAAGAAPLVTDLMANGTFGTPLTPIAIIATNSPTSYNAVGLPGGLAVNTTTGVITGTPTATGLFSVALSATNAIGTGAGTLTLTIAQAAQTITFNGPASQAFSVVPITLSATASSGLPVSFTVVTGPATISGSNLTLSGPGTVVIRASQAGNANYDAAPTVDCMLVVTGSSANPVPPIDFNGDGKPDILLENTVTGQRVLWLMGGPNNAYVTQGLDLGFLDHAWQIVGTADFNGDGKPDILLENSVTGQRVLWLMGGPNNAYVTQGLDLGFLDPSWHIAGTADFNGDGKPDILLENSVTGQRVLWLMGGPASQYVALGLDLGVLDASWHIVAIADFNTDGKPDILLENIASGQRVLWLMGGPNNAYVIQGLDLGSLDPVWHIVSAADFNADGKPDILLENTVSGQRVLWLMGGPNNAYVTLALDLGSLDPAWHIVK